MKQNPIKESKSGVVRRSALIQTASTVIQCIFTMSLIGCATLKWFPGEAPTPFYSGSVIYPQSGIWATKLKKVIGKNAGAIVSIKSLEPNCVASRTQSSPNKIGGLSFFYLSKHQSDIDLSYTGYSGLDCHEILGYVPDSIMVDSIEIFQEPNKRQQLDLWIYAGGGK